MNFLNIKNTLKNTLKNNSGFTLIETLVAIALISLISLPVFMVTSDIVTFTKKIKDLNRWNGELIKLERVLRKSVRGVQIPFWISNIELTEGTNAIRIPYWNGEAGLVLEMEIEDKTFKITTPEGTRGFKGYDGVEFDFLKDSKLRTIGLSINVKKIKREDVEFQCALGAIGRDVFSEK